MSCDDFVKSATDGGCPPPSRRRWTDSERRWLRAHRGDGLAAVAAALGRSEKAVTRQAERMGITVPVRPTVAELCPVCGRHRMSPGTSAWRAGMCAPCWERHKADVMDERAAELRARREYEAAKARARRART